MWVASSLLFSFIFFSYTNHMVSECFFQSKETVFGRELWEAWSYSSSDSLIHVKVNISSGNRGDSQVFILYFCGWEHVWYSKHAWKIRSVMTTYYTVSENFTHCLASQDAQSELMLVLLYINVWKGSAISISNFSCLWGATFYVQWTWVGNWLVHGWWCSDWRWGPAWRPQQPAHNVSYALQPAHAAASAQGF